MPTKGISVRLDEDLLEWADRYAEERSSAGREVTRTMLLETALSNLREDAESGVPDIRERVREMRRAQAPKPGECSCPRFDKGARGFSNACPVHGGKSREDFAAGCAARAELFKGLTAPESVRFGVKKGKES